MPNDSKFKRWPVVGANGVGGIRKLKSRLMIESSCFNLIKDFEEIDMI